MHTHSLSSFRSVSAITLLWTSYTKFPEWLAIRGRFCRAREFVLLRSAQLLPGSERNYSHPRAAPERGALHRSPRSLRIVRHAPPTARRLAKGVPPPLCDWLLLQGNIHPDCTCTRPPARAASSPGSGTSQQFPNLEQNGTHLLYITLLVLSVHRRFLSLT